MKSYFVNKIDKFNELVRELDNYSVYKDNNLENKIYQFLVFDRKTIELLEKDLSSKIKELSEGYDDLNEFINYLGKYYLHSDDYWYYFGNKGSDKYKFRINELKFKYGSIVFKDPTLSFKYYLKVDLEQFLNDPKKVINFYKEIIEESYPENEVYQFKLPKKFQEFILRRDGFVLYLNKDKINKFLEKIEKKIKEHGLENKVRGMLGFDIRLPCGKGLSYSQLISKKAIIEGKKVKI